MGRPLFQHLDPLEGPVNPDGGNGEAITVHQAERYRLGWKLVRQ